jgi:protein-tyrosine phosphatase
MIDLHCHILPGLDDGAKTLEESVEMARIARDDGITTSVATPHLFRGGNTVEKLNGAGEKLEELRRALKAANIEVNLLAGAEVHISHNLIGEIRNNRKSMVLNGSSYMFVEFPSEHIYPGVKNLFFDLMSEGINPIIAHPERNSVFAQNPGLLFDLVGMGALAQANSGSFTGLYGRQAAEVVVRFLEWNLIHFIASDAHGPKSIPPGLSEAVARAESLVGKERAKAFVEDNPRAVLEDREIPVLLSPVNPKDKRKSFSIKLPKFVKLRR